LLGHEINAGHAGELPLIGVDECMERVLSFEG
jgi:hypothetical protein